MIEDVIARWHNYIAGNEPLDGLLDDDVVFYSPVVFTPQRGKPVTAMYLVAAMTTLGAAGDFRYTKQVVAGDHAVLEFETTLEGKYVNGVDIITANAEDRITEFRVMIRPLQAVNVIHQQMAAMLASIADGALPMQQQEQQQQ